MIHKVRIGFDTRAAFLDPHRGFGRIARSLVEALLAQAPGEVVPFVPHGYPVPPRWYPLAAHIVQLRRPRRGAFVVDPLAWSLTAPRQRLDVLHLPAWGVPPGLRTPVVATFHDATPFLFPSPASRWKRWRGRLAIRSLARAAAVHAVSHHAAAEAVAFARVTGERVHVVHWGVGFPFVPPEQPGPGEHVLFVGGGEPHKNLEVVLAAYRLARSEVLPNLVVAGPAAADPTVAARLGEGPLGGRIRLAPALSDERLASLYGDALATVVPSRHEGFGLPALEAMACGSPVLAARAGALPEVCGDAAELLDPDDPAAWRDALLALQNSAEKRHRLRTAGLARAALFTWEKCAREMIAIYRELTRERNALT